jgi:hypothetical protein
MIDLVDQILFNSHNELGSYQQNILFPQYGNQIGGFQKLQKGQN